MSRLSYDEYKKMRDNGQIVYSADTLSDYFEKAQGILTDVYDNQNNSYKWATESSKEYTGMIDSLSSDNNYINMYLDSIKDTDEYESLSSQYSQYKSALSQARDYLKGVNSFASQFDSEDSYNTAVTEANRQQKYKDYSYDDLIKASEESQDEDEAKWLKNHANETVSFEEIRDIRDKAKTRQDEVNAKIKKYADKELAAGLPSEKQKYADLLAPLYEESDELTKQLRDYNSLFKSKQAQKNAEEYETKYKGLNYGELLSEIRDDKSSEENTWLQSKADETATSEDYQKQLDELKTKQEIEHPNWGGANEYTGEITELENKLKLKQREEKAAEYEELINAPDFTAKNKMEWNHIGGNDMLSYMNDEEKGVYSYLYNSGREDEAQEYSKLIEPRLTERYTQANNEWAQEFATEHPWLASGLSLGSNLISGFGIVEDIGKRVVGDPIDTNSQMHYGANITRALRNTVSDKYLGDVGTFGYDTVMSAADSAINMAVSTAIGGAIGAAGSLSSTAVESLTASVSSAIMGSQVATSTVIDAKERGLSDDQAVTLGVLYGVAEGISEKYSIENFIHDPKTVASALGKAFVAEGSEEVVANYLDRIADAVVAGDKNEVTQRYKNYLAQGYSETEAFTLCAYALIGDDTSSFLAGGLSGVAMSGTHMAFSGGIGKAQEVKSQNDYKKDVGKELVKAENKEQLDELIKSAKATDKDGREYKLAEKFEQQIENGEKLNAKEVGTLYTLMEERSAKEFSDEFNSVTEDFTDEEKAYTAAAVSAIAAGQSLTKEQVNTIKSNAKISSAVAKLASTDEDSVINLIDSSKKLDNSSYYKSNGNGLLEYDGKEFHGTVEIESIDRKTGEATYRLTSPDNTERTAKASDIKFADDNEAKLHETAAGLYVNPNEANAFIENYKGGEIKEYTEEWNLFSNYGRLGLDISKNNRMSNGYLMDIGQKNAAYSYGIEAFTSYSQGQMIAAQARANSANFGYTKGTFKNTVSNKTRLSQEQKNTVRLLEMLSNLGLNVEVFESQTDKKGNYKGENGSFNAKTKALRIDINAGYDNVKQAITDSFKYAMANTVSHELTHTAEQGKYYNELRSEIIRVLDLDGKDFNELVEKKVAELKKKSKYQDLSSEELLRVANAEVIADGCETMLQDTKLFDNIIEENPSLAKKILSELKKIFAEVIGKIRAYFKENPKIAKTEYGQAVLDAMSKYENRIQELWDKAVAEGIKAANAGVEASSDSTTQFSIRTDIDGRKFVDVDPDIYDNTDGKTVAQVIAKIISSRFNNLIEANGQKIQINKTTNDEWRMSKSARYLQKTDTQMYNDKLHAIANADEILRAANNWVGEELTHNRTDDIKEFARGNIQYKVGNNGYIADVIVGTRENGAAVLYDIKNIYSKKITEAPRVTKGDNASNSLRTPLASVKNTIPQSKSKSNSSSQQNSDRFNESDYLSAVDRGDIETAQRMVDEAAERAFNNSKIRDDSGRLIKVYHGTEDDFTVFDKTKGRANMDIQGMFFSPWELDAQGYGSNVRAFYLNITNPASESVGYKALNNHKGENNAGIKAREDLVRMGYDGVNNSDEEYIAFNSSQIKSADPVTYDDDGNVIPLSERFNEEKEDIRYQDRIYNEGKSDRELLAEAMEGIVRNDFERESLQRYKSYIDKIDKAANELIDVNKKIKDISFTKGSDRSQLPKLNAQKKKLENQISYWDKKLINSFESAKPLKDLFERGRKEAFRRQREKSNKRLKDYQENARKRTLYDRIEWNVKRLNKFLDSADPNKRVKEGLRDINEKILKTSQYLLYDNLSTRDIVRNGVENATPEEQKLLKQYHDIIGNVDHKLTDAERETLKDLRTQLKDLINREKAAFEKGREELFASEFSKSLVELQEAYKLIKDSDLAYIRDAYDDAIVERIEEFKKEVDKTLSKDLTSAQLEDFRKIVAMIAHTISRSNKLHASSKSYTETAQTVMSEIEGNRKNKEIRWVLPQFFGKTILWNNFKPVYAIRYIGSKELEKIYWKIQQGELDWMNDIEEARDFLWEMKDKYDYKHFDMKLKKTFKAANGTEFELTKDQMFAVYVLSRREQALQHLLKGGFTFPKGEKAKGGKHTGSTSYPLNAQIIADITNELSDNEKHYAEALQKYLSEVMAKKGNEVSMELYGVELFNEDSYWSIQSSADHRQVDTTEPKGQFMRKNAGFTKATVRNASNPIVLNGFENAWADHVNEMSLYHATTLPIEDFSKVLNYNARAEENKTVKNVRTVLNGSFGQASTDYFNTFLKDINGGFQVDSRDKVADKLISHAKKAAVMLNLSVVLQQPMAAIRAMNYISPRFFLPVKLPAHSSKWEQLKKYAKVASIKEMGIFDVGMGQGAVEWINTDKRQALLGDGISGFVKAIGNNAKDIVVDSSYRDEVLSRGASYADEVAWLKIWNAVQHETKAKYGFALNSEKNLIKSGERFNEVVHLTQVYDSVLTRSHVMRSKSPYLKMATSFMAEPTTIVNMAVDAGVQFARTKNVRPLLRTGATLIVSMLFNNLMKSIAGAMRDDDDKDDEGNMFIKYRNALTINILNDINPASYFPISRDIVSLVEGYHVDRMDMTLVSNVFNSVRKVLEDPTDTNIWKFAGRIFDCVGIPLYNVVRDVQSVINTYNKFRSQNQTVYQKLTLEAEAAYQSSYDKSWTGGEEEEKCESKAKSAAKTKITDKLKPFYLEALKKQDSNTIYDVRRFMCDSGYYDSLDEVDKSLENWRKAGEEQEEKSKRAEERKKGNERN